MQVILNLQICLIIETGIDQHWENLPTINEVAMFILDEYEKPGFLNIILAKKMLDLNST